MRGVRNAPTTTFARAGQPLLVLLLAQLASCTFILVPILLCSLAFLFCFPLPGRSLISCSTASQPRLCNMLAEPTPRLGTASGCISHTLVEAQVSPRPMRICMWHDPMAPARHPCSHPACKPTIWASPIIKLFLQILPGLPASQPFSAWCELSVVSNSVTNPPRQKKCSSAARLVHGDLACTTHAGQCGACTSQCKVARVSRNCSA